MGGSPNKTPIVLPWRHVAMGGELMGELLPSSQLDVCQIHYYSGYSQKYPYQVSIFGSGLHPG